MNVRPDNVSDFVSLDVAELALACGGDGETADQWWGRRIGGVAGAVGGGTLGFLAGAPLSPVGQAATTIAGGAVGQYAGEEYGARRGASGLAVDAATAMIPGGAALRAGYNWLRSRR
jgi:hypothetical protein